MEDSPLIVGRICYHQNLFLFPPHVSHGRGRGGCCPLSAGLIRVLVGVVLPCTDQTAGTIWAETNGKEAGWKSSLSERLWPFESGSHWCPEISPGVGGWRKERGCVRRDGGGGLVWSGTLGPQAGTQERKCSRECNLLKWNERHARVPCVSSRGEMIDWERLEEGGSNGPRESYSWDLQYIPTLFLFMLAISPSSCPLKRCSSRRLTRAIIS